MDVPVYLMNLVSVNVGYVFPFYSLLHNNVSLISEYMKPKGCWLKIQVVL